MRVELGMARIGRGNPAAQVVSPGIVGVPERILAVGKIDASLGRRHIQTKLFESAQEGHLHVQIVLVE